jgi:hypothetical protein
MYLTALAEPCWFSSTRVSVRGDPALVRLRRGLARGFTAVARHGVQLSRLWKHDAYLQR